MIAGHMPGNESGARSLCEIPSKRVQPGSINQSITSALKDEKFPLRVQIEGLVNIRKGTRPAPTDNIIEASVIYGPND